MNSSNQQCAVSHVEVCPQCNGQGILSRCRNGKDCYCAMLDMGVACRFGFSMPCIKCQPHIPSIALAKHHE